MSRRAPGRASPGGTALKQTSPREKASARVTSGDAQRQTLLETIAEECRRMSTRSVLLHAAVADKLGLNPSDHKCADVLREQPGPITAGRLAELTGLSTGAITGVLDRLERAGFVARDQDPNDRRRVVIRCTPERAPDLRPLFMPLRDGTIASCSRYTDRELRLILDFMQSTELVVQEHMERLTRLEPIQRAAEAPGPERSAVLQRSAALPRSRVQQRKPPAPRKPRTR
jgi:DNA-binding MarR family transcriptional regulator